MGSPVRTIYLQYIIKITKLKYYFRWVHVLYGYKIPKMWMSSAPDKFLRCHWWCTVVWNKEVLSPPLNDLKLSQIYLTSVTTNITLLAHKSSNLLLHRLFWLLERWHIKRRNAIQPNCFVASSCRLQTCTHEFKATRSHYASQLSSWERRIVVTSR